MLKPGGRISLADLTVEGELPAGGGERSERLGWVSGRRAGGACLRREA